MASATKLYRSFRRPKTPKPLPDKLSDLLELAVKDARRLERTKGFKLNMCVWVDRLNKKAPCEVCMAGAVMVCELGASTEVGAVTWPGAQPAARTTTLDDKLHAINYMRSGLFESAAYRLCLGHITHQRVLQEARCCVEPSYDRSHNMRASWAAYGRAVKVLRAAGL